MKINNKFLILLLFSLIVILTFNTSVFASSFSVDGSTYEYDLPEFFNSDTDTIFISYYYSTLDDPDSLRINVMYWRNNDSIFIDSNNSNFVTNKAGTMYSKDFNKEDFSSIATTPRDSYTPWNVSVGSSFALGIDKKNNFIYCNRTLYDQDGNVVFQAPPQQGEGIILLQSGEEVPQAMNQTMKVVLPVGLAILGIGLVIYLIKSVIYRIQ